MSAARSTPAGPSRSAPPRPASTSRDALWVSGARLVSQLCGIGALLIGARLLSPAEVGLFAMLSAVVLLQSRIAEAGWSEYIIALAPDRTLPGTVLYCALASGIGFTALSLAGLAAWVGWAGPDPATALCLLLLVGTIIPGTLVICQNGVLIRERRLRDLASYQVVSEICGLLVTVLGLFQGWGVVALAAGRCCAVLVALLMSVRLARWLPRWEFDPGRARDAAAYSARLLLSRVIQFVQGYGADFLIAFLVGMTEVGVFRIANRIVGAVTELVSEPVRMLAWSYLSRARAADPARKGAGAMVGEMLAATVFVALPIFVGLAAVSHDLAIALLGEAWAEVGVVLAWLAIARGVAVIQMFNEPVLSITGRVSSLPYLNILFTGISLATLAVAGWIGPDLSWLAASQTAAAILSTTLSLYVLRRVSFFSATALLRRVAPALCATALMLLAVLASLRTTGQLGWPAAPGLLGAVLVGIGMYFAAAWYSGRTVLESLNRMIARFETPRPTEGENAPAAGIAAQGG